MKFTVVICTYNNAKSLVDTLHSINECRNVSWRDIELLVVDNNSNDDTREVCERFARISKFRVSYVYEARQGLSFARNRAINELKEGVAIFTDDDVIVSEDWLTEYMSAYLRSGSDAVFGKILPQWGGSEPEWYDGRFSACYAILDYGEKEIRVDQIGQQFYGANFSCKVDLIREFGGFDTELGRKGDQLFVGEETELFLKLLKGKRKMLYVPEIIVWHVIREERKTKEFIKNYFLDTAHSEVYLSKKISKRSFLGLPLYQYKYFTLQYLKLYPRLILMCLIGDIQERWRLALQLAKINRMIKLYFVQYLYKEE